MSKRGSIYFFLLPDLDSNQDTQIQNLTYYHYTIGQWDCKYTCLSFYCIAEIKLQVRRYYCVKSNFLFVNQGLNSSILYSLILNTKYVIRNYSSRPISTLIAYYLKGLKIFFFLRSHLRLSKALKPFNTSGFITAKIYYIYLFKYLSYSFSTKNKISILTNHYEYFKKNFPYHSLRHIFKDGLKCWSEIKDSNVFEIRLISTTPYENEGSLSFVFNMNGETIYRLAFTFSPGSQFGLLDEQVIYVTRIQGVKGSLDDISKSSRFFNDNTPPTLLVSALEGMALSLGIKTIVGISLQNQISYLVSDKYSFQKNYDEFWKTYESIKISDGDFLLMLPLQHKGLALIKSKHRSRTINKRKVRQDISRKLYAYFNSNILTGKRIKLSPLRVAREAKATA